MGNVAAIGDQLNFHRTGYSVCYAHDLSRGSVFIVFTLEYECRAVDFRKDVLDIPVLKFG
jgi:hypothetical protein